MASLVFLKVGEVQRWRQKLSHSRHEVQPCRRLDRRLFSVWSAGRPVFHSTQIGVAYVSHRRLPTATLAGILVPCCYGSGTQERPVDGTQYTWDAQPVQITQQRCNGRIFGRCTYTSLAAALSMHWLQTILQSSRYSDEVFTTVI